jgi:hypothetical protein
VLSNEAWALKNETKGQPPKASSTLIPNTKYPIPKTGFLSLISIKTFNTHPTLFTSLNSCVFDAFLFDFNDLLPFVLILAPYTKLFFPK